MSFTDEQIDAIIELDRLGALTDADKATIKKRMIEGPARIPQPTQQAIAEAEARKRERPRKALRGALSTAADVATEVTVPVENVGRAFTGGLQGLLGNKENQLSIQERTAQANQELEQARQDSPVATGTARGTAAGAAALLGAGVAGVGAAKAVGAGVKGLSAVVKSTKLKLAGLDKGKKMEEATKVYNQLPPEAKKAVKFKASLAMVGL